MKTTPGAGWARVGGPEGRLTWTDDGREFAGRGRAWVVHTGRRFGGRRSIARWWTTNPRPRPHRHAARDDRAVARREPTVAGRGQGSPRVGWRWPVRWRISGLGSGFRASSPNAGPGGIRAQGRRFRRPRHGRSRGSGRIAARWTLSARAPRSVPTLRFQVSQRQEIFPRRVRGAIPTPWAGGGRRGGGEEGRGGRERRGGGEGRGPAAGPRRPKSSIAAGAALPKTKRRSRSRDPRPGPAHPPVRVHLLTRTPPGAGQRPNAVQWGEWSTNRADDGLTLSSS